MKIILVVILVGFSLTEARKGDSREVDRPTTIEYERRIKSLELRYSDLDILINRINRKLQSQIDDLNIVVIRLDNRVRNLTNSNNGNSNSNNADNNSNNNNNNNVDRFVIDKGVWKFDGLFDGGNSENQVGNKIVKRDVIARFSEKFKKKPKIFYTLKTQNVRDNKAALYKIYNEFIDLDRNTLSASVDFYGTFNAIELEFEWIAIGY